MLHLLKEALDEVVLHDPNIPFVVVDLGCSCGINTINVMDVIIKHITKRYEALGFNPPEFSAFFSDLPSNDFNTLFQLLPPLANYGVSMEECLAANNHRSYFAAGVPGSFYRRLFPARSVDFFHSAFSLHWLSQVIYQFLLIYQHHSFFSPLYSIDVFLFEILFYKQKVHQQRNKNMKINTSFRPPARY
jgi:indole-3-acetate O-methyltransferase